ncbi:MAG: NifB/NifX family molybdenum-iron cluster-binding protein [Thermodesulfobacteriota bacterium]|nr:NifB/NifX family molybdenum-iron cluster-binding protein [Thermodesulfobacteriota bacterium]
MSRIAIPTWNGRVSPVFDAAERLLIIDIKGKKECSRFETEISEANFPVRATRLKKLGVDTLICGAISMPLLYMITNVDIRVIPWISGRAEDVLKAFLDEKLFQFLMPGTGRYRGKGHGRKHGQTMGRRRGIHIKQ